jgi:hypothetical protein
VFASNEYFGKEYKKKFMFRMKDLLSKILPIIPHEHVFHDYLDNQVICVFARRDFYSSNFLIQKSFGSNVVENIDEILKREMINQDTYMIILN